MEGLIPIFFRKFNSEANFCVEQLDECIFQEELMISDADEFFLSDGKKYF